MLVVAAFIPIILLWIKRENKITDEMVSALSEDLKISLQDNQVEDFDSQRHIWTQKAYIVSVRDKGTKVVSELLWYNTVIQNATLNQFGRADVTMKKAEFEGRGLKQGMIVKMRIDPHKCKVEII